MKFAILLLAGSISLSFVPWQPDFETAKKLARETNKFILVNFSGSDWCGPCIRLHKEVFESQEFKELTDQSLILYNADFPRNKKNQLSKALQQSNEALADKYNPLGKFPYTVILTPGGKVIKAWEGYSNNNSAQFIEQIKSACNANRN
ncbi:thioredoxin family protein [Niastella caeni]|uniref:Thioredoxin family protein n=1 Tax=Niastella caeni TaxID=2569763 RepID=A0A4S8I1F8_9BACT|nr:thioredoxin family protein [Niastella caeni]THU39522.1 thioredoxin family protein [Niastella caeni]